MRGRHNMHGIIGLFVIVAAIAFVFGDTAARFVVGSGLVIGALFFAYIMFRVVMGTI